MLYCCITRIMMTLSLSPGFWGLCEEIRSAITLHRSKTVQEASVLAIIQETELE